MSEVTKLYENCNIKTKQKGYCDWGNYCPYPYNKCNDECPYWKYEDEAKYPPFTPEKQLKLIEFFISSVWWMNLKSLYKTLDCSLNFEDKLARMVNYLWLSLTPEEKQQVKGILE